MSIDLTAVAFDPMKRGDDTFQVAPGQSLRIETSPGGEELLDVEVPAGKVWTCYVYVRVVESTLS